MKRMKGYPSKIARQHPPPSGKHTLHMRERERGRETRSRKASKVRGRVSLIIEGVEVRVHHIRAYCCQPNRQHTQLLFV